MIGVLAMPYNDDDLLTAAEVAAVLKKHPRTIRNWIRDRRIKFTEIYGRGGREYRIRYSDIFDVQPTAKKRAAFPVITRPCAGVTKAGTSCNAVAMAGSAMCRHHQSQEETS